MWDRAQKKGRVALLTKLINGQGCNVLNDRGGMHIFSNDDKWEDARGALKTYKMGRVLLSN